MSVKQMSLVWELDLPQNHKLVLLAYADHADDDGDNVYPSLSRIAHKTGYSVNQVRRISRALVEKGLMFLVEKGVGRGNAHRYKLTLEKGTILEPFSPKVKKVPSGEKKVPSEPIKPTIAMVPEPSIENHHVEPSYSRRDVRRVETSTDETQKHNWFTEFCNRSKELGLLITPEDRKSVPRHLKTLTQKHNATDVEMQRVLTSMLDARLRDWSMSPQQALNKVRGIPSAKRKPKTSTSSIAVIGATEDDYAPESYIGAEDDYRIEDYR